MTVNPTSLERETKMAYMHVMEGFGRAGMFAAIRGLGCLAV